MIDTINPELADKLTRQILEEYDRICSECPGEDCICCEIYLDRQAMTE